MSRKKPAYEDMQQIDDQNQAEPKPNTETEAQRSTPEASALEAELKSARALAAENEDKFVRAKAETENIRRRAEIDVANAHKYGIERLVAELLSVRDSLELAKGVDLNQGTQVVEKVKEGLDLTLKQMDTVFQKFAVTLIDPAKGEKFDPEKHQAVSMADTDEIPPNHVLHVMQKGYTLSNRLLRPAMVIVAKAKSVPTT